MKRKDKPPSYAPPACSRSRADGRRLRGAHKSETSSGGLLCIYCRLHPHETQANEADWPEE